MEKQEILEQLYDMYEQKMYIAAYSILNSTEQAEDIVHDSFLKLIKYLPKIDDPNSPETKVLVMRILKTTAIDQYRKNHNKIRFIKEKVIKGHDVIDTHNNTEQNLENKTYIQDILNELSPDHLDVIKLRYYYGFSGKETAEILSISEANVNKRVQRAKNQILIKLQGDV